MPLEGVNNVSELIQHPTDQQVADSIYSTRQGYQRAYQIQQRTRKISTRQQAEVEAIKLSGFTSRSGARFETDEARYGTRTPIAQPSEFVPVIQPTPKPTPPVERIDHKAAKVAFRLYHSGSANGYERGQQFVSFGQAVGIIDDKACGVRDQAQADLVSHAIYHELNFARYAPDLRPVPQVAR